MRASAPPSAIRCRALPYWRWCCRWWRARRCPRSTGCWRRTSCAGWAGAPGAYLWHEAALILVGLATGVNLVDAGLRERLMVIPLVLAVTWLLAGLSYAFVFKPARLKPLLTRRAGVPAPTLFEARINPQSKSELVALLTTAPPAGAGVRSVTMNLDHVVRLQENAAFRRAYDRAWAVTIDGAPVWLFSKLKGLQGRPLHRLGPDRGVDRGAAAGCASAVLRGQHRGDRPAADAAVALPGFAEDQIGYVSPPFGFDRDLDSPSACAPPFAARTAPIWCSASARRSRRSGSIGTAIGWATSTPARWDPARTSWSPRPVAPRALQAAGMEWAWRVAHDRRRLFQPSSSHSWAFIPAALRDLGARCRRSSGFRPGTGA